MSETELLQSETEGKKNNSDSFLKDSKSCGDLKAGSSSTGSATSTYDSRNVAEDLKTSHMCAQLCSLMKAQLLKTYEEVVCRYGGHFDMSLMQACQVRIEVFIGICINEMFFIYTNSVYSLFAYICNLFFCIFFMHVIKILFPSLFPPFPSTICFCFHLHSDSASHFQTVHFHLLYSDIYTI